MMCLRFGIFACAVRDKLEKGIWNFAELCRTLDALVIDSWTLYASVTHSDRGQSLERTGTPGRVR
jgi:hypothetical protein